ncbi:hypothetical protein FHS85_000289 [Rhodoligotrophos appendicifer]|uniref:hypothetical protein n=1 Tax=Rhodoligotrophos appendicifer TaxID=987056 RepID=UPI00117D0F71|nr:hypothetical protein [Rhodoligotrophos appendicifer]
MNYPSEIADRFMVFAGGTRVESWETVYWYKGRYWVFQPGETFQERVNAAENFATLWTEAHGNQGSVQFRYMLGDESVAVLLPPIGDHIAAGGGFSYPSTVPTRAEIITSRNYYIWDEWKVFRHGEDVYRLCETRDEAVAAQMAWEETRAQYPNLKISEIVEFPDGGFALKTFFEQPTGDVWLRETKIQLAINELHREVNELKSKPANGQEPTVESPNRNADQSADAREPQSVGQVDPSVVSRRELLPIPEETDAEAPDHLMHQHHADPLSSMMIG